MTPYEAAKMLQTLEQYRQLDGFLNEDDFQLAIVQMLRRLCPEPPQGPWWTAINPKPGKTKTVAALSKAMGLRAGAPDLVFSHCGRFLGLELKCDQGHLSKSQKNEIPKLKSSGASVTLARSMNEAIDFLLNHGVPLRERADPLRQAA